MAVLWHLLCTHGRAKGPIYSWPVNVENGAMEIIAFRFSPLFSGALFIVLLLLRVDFPPLCQPGSYLGAGGDLLVSGAASIPCISDEALDCAPCVCVCVSAHKHLNLCVCVPASVVRCLFFWFETMKP